MKKYIAPVAKNILLRSELSMLLDTSSNYNDGLQLSNQRQRSASSVIWGFDDETIIEGEY